MKINLILGMFDAFLCGEIVTRKKFCEENGMSERTFYRYLKIVSDYVKKYKSGYFIDLSNIKGAYYLKRF